MKTALPWRQPGGGWSVLPLRRAPWRGSPPIRGGLTWREQGGMSCGDSAAHAIVYGSTGGGFRAKVEGTHQQQPPHKRPGQRRADELFTVDVNLP